MKIKNKKVLIINLGWEQEPMLDRIAELGFEVYGIHYNDNYYKGVKYRDILITDLRDIDRILKYANKVKPDAVISDQCDYSYFAQAVIAEKYNLPGPKIESAQIATNKYLQRERSLTAGILIPKFRPCLSLKDVEDFAEHVSFPIMLKPVDNRGSFGVNKVNSAEEAKEAFYDALINSHSRYVIAEKFIDGTHLTVDGYVFHECGAKALAVATKDKLKVKHSIIDGEILYPGELEERLYKKAEMCLENVATRLGFTFGFLHGEFILTKDGEIYLTEIANRGGGVYTSEVIVPNVSGVNIVDIYINDVLGINMSNEATQSLKKIGKKPTILKFFSFSDKKGIVKRIDGLEEIAQNPSVLKIKMLIKKGDVIKDISNGAERHGLMIIDGDDKELLFRNMRDALSGLEVHIEEC